MGLFRRLVLLPLAPVEGVLWLGRTMQQLAEQELYDPERLHAQLVEAEDARRRGEITDEELAAIEGVVLDRLLEARSVEQATADG